MSTVDQPKARSPINHVVLALVVTTVSFCYFATYCDDARLASDSADYIALASHGFPSLYLDSGSITPWGLYSLARKQPKIGSHVWDYLDRVHDPASRRHFHVALSFYPWAFAVQFGAGDRGQRLLAAAEGAVVAGVACLGLLSAGVAALLCLAAVLLLMLSPSIVTTFTDPSPHPIFLGLMLAFGFVFAACLKHRAGKPAYLSAVAVLLALVAATLELSIVVAVAAVAIAACRAWRGWVFRDLARAAPLSIATLFVAWPGGVLRGGYILSYGAFLHLALYRRGTFGSSSFYATLMRGSDMSPSVLIVFIVLAVALALLFARGKSNPYLDVFGWLWLGFGCQGILNRFHNPTYAAHFLALGWILFALCAQQWIETTRGWSARSATAVLLLLAGAGAAHWPAVSRRMTETRDVFSRRAEEVTNYVRSNVPRGSAIVANSEHGLWRYYLPGYPVESMGPGNLHPEPAVPVQTYWVIADPDLPTPPWRPGIMLESHTILGGFSIYKCHPLP